MKSNRLLAAAVLMACASMAPAAMAQTPAPNHGQANVSQKIAANFVNLAGSQDNALALVNGLRNGTDVKLVTVKGTGTTAATTTTTLDPPTGKMGWGNVKISLGLAQDALLRAGITQPTAQQLQTALNGGTLTRADGTTVAVKGVLQMRADGMGWGQIAHAGGTKVGPVVSSLKATQSNLSKGMTTAAGTPASTPAKVTSKGITTATGAAPASASRGLVTAEGSSAQQPKAHGHGRGIVTASGGGTGAGLAASGKSGVGAGVISGSGASAASVTTANGAGGVNGKGNAGGNGNGKGKGG